MCLNKNQKGIKMKKLLTILISLSIIFATTSCAKNKAIEEYTGFGEFDVVFLANIDSFYEDRNADIYSGVKKYCNENNLTINYLQVQKDSEEDKQTVISQALDEFKASIIVTADSNWINTIDDASKTYTNVKFILIDTNEFEANNNVAQFCFSEYDKGYLVGYVLAHEEFLDIGVIVDNQEEFKDGLLDGVNYVKRNEEVYPIIRIQELQDVDDIDEVISEWYKADVEIILSCGSALSNVETLNNKYEGKYNVSYNYNLENAAYAAVNKAMKNWNEYSSKYTSLKLSDNYIDIHGNYRFVKYDKTVLEQLSNELENQ